MIHLKIPDTSRQSGGAVIKLKGKDKSTLSNESAASQGITKAHKRMFFHGNKRLKRTVITLLIIVAGLFLCNFLYLMLDYGFNGFVREWFGREYVYMEWVPIE